MSDIQDCRNIVWDIPVLGRTSCHFGISLFFVSPFPKGFMCRAEDENSANCVKNSMIFFY